MLENIFIKGKDERLIPIPNVVLDTGFNDDFCIPSEFEDLVQLAYLGHKEFMLGDGSIISEATYEAEIIIGNTPKVVVISFTDDDEALLGTRLLENAVVTMDFKNRTVLIEGV
jgi:predicted aspartyl protease